MSPVDCGPEHCCLSFEQLRRGDAEIFGAQIGLGEKVTVSGQKIAVRPVAA